MRKYILLLFAIISPWLVMNAESLDSLYRGGAKVVDLWPEGAPHDNGIDYLNPDLETKRIYKPQMHVFTVKSKTPTKAVILMPGGAYEVLAVYKEGFMWKQFFNREKVATIVLTYRTPNGHHEVPAEDVYQAMRLVKQHAEEWNIDTTQIGVMGFSAGGHLASTVATHAPTDVWPAFQILFYPVISMSDELTHKQSRNNLLGNNDTPELREYYSNELQVKPFTPRAYIIAADNDKVVPVMNSIKYYEALKKYKIPAEMHLFPSGGHGFGIYPSFKYHEALMKTLSDWLILFDQYA